MMNLRTTQLKANDDQGRQPTAPPHDMAAANRTVSCDKTLPIHANSLERQFRSGYTYSSLRRCSPSQVAILSVRRVSPDQVLHTQLKPLIMPWSCGVWRSTRLIGHWNRCRKEFQLECNLAPAFHKTHSAKLQVLVHCLVIQMSCSQVRLVISTNSSYLDVTIDHETLQPQRRGCDLSDASSTTSHCNGSSCRCVQFDFEAGAVNSIT